MHLQEAHDRSGWEDFLTAREWSPFLQSFTMGEVYREVQEEPVRLEVREGSLDTRRSAHSPGGAARNDTLIGICQAIVVNAKRGRHLAVMYGPVLAMSDTRSAISLLVDELKRIAKEKGCSFIRMSPFVRGRHALPLHGLGFRKSPLHLLAEHIWYLDLRGKSEDDILMGMRKTTRNLIRRAERERVEVSASRNPMEDLSIFFELYEETRKRHRFVPYPEEFIRAQVMAFAPKGECALYIARYRGEPVSASVHMIYGRETSYHHGASSSKHPKCYASYLLQWRAIQDALKRGDRVYNFWGIAPVLHAGNSKFEMRNAKHPFAGVTTFKTGFGGQLLELQHCMDLPLSPKYWITYGIETGRKWKRGF